MLKTLAGVGVALGVTLAAGQARATIFTINLEGVARPFDMVGQQQVFVEPTAFLLSCTYDHQAAVSQPTYFSLTFGDIRYEITLPPKTAIWTMTVPDVQTSGINAEAPGSWTSVIMGAINFGLEGAFTCTSKCNTTGFWFQDGARSAFLDVTGYAITSGSGEIAEPAGSVTAPIPEPSTWALLILGFGMIGAAMRRADRTATSPAGANNGSAPRRRAQPQTIPRR